LLHCQICWANVRDREPLTIVHDGGFHQAPRAWVKRVSKCAQQSVIGRHHQERAQWRHENYPPASRQTPKDAQFCNAGFPALVGNETTMYVICLMTSSGFEMPPVQKAFQIAST
jgi:hypothetical protein